MKIDGEFSNQIFTIWWQDNFCDFLSLLNIYAHKHTQALPSPHIVLNTHNPFPICCRSLSVNANHYNSSNFLQLQMIVKMGPQTVDQ